MIDLQRAYLNGFIKAAFGLMPTGAPNAPIVPPMAQPPIVNNMPPTAQPMGPVAQPNAQQQPAQAMPPQPSIVTLMQQQGGKQLDPRASQVKPVQSQYL